VVSYKEKAIMIEVLIILKSLTKKKITTCQRLNLLQVELGTTESTLVCPLDRTSFTSEFLV
jgi:hypothetical protein